MVFSQALENVLQSPGGMTVDVKDVLSRFTTDTICSYAFGLEVNSLQNCDAELKKILSTALRIELRTKIWSVLMRSFPSVLKYFPVK